MARKKGDSRPFWTIDAETDPFKRGRVPEPFLWGVYDGLDYYEFDKTADVIEFIRGHNVIVYAHNGGKFDFHFILDEINRDEPVTVINGRLVSAKVGLCEIRDSYSLLPVPLATFGQKLDIDYSIMEKGEREKPHNRKEISEYLRVDCKDLWEKIEQFQMSYGRHLTQAGAAMKTWEGMHGEKAPQSDNAYFYEYSPFYYGGRVQCFKSGHIAGPLQVYDINSAYPWAMLSDHPYGLDTVTDENPPGFRATSFVTVECESFGALPYRDERGIMTFPDDGEPRIYQVCGHELQAGIDTGTVAQVRLIKVTDHTRLVSFREYIEHFFALRQEAKRAGDIAGDIFAKLLMNSLYGKFGANPDNYGNFMLSDWAKAEDREYEGYQLDGAIGPYALLKAPLDDWQMRYYNVATAASITSAVRAKLWRAIKNSAGVAYCDTDSLLCARTGEPQGAELGAWKHEGTVSDAWIAGKKMYALRGDFGKGQTEKLATKGVKLTLADIAHIAEGGTAFYSPIAPTFRLRGEPVFTGRTVRRTA